MFISPDVTAYYARKMGAQSSRPNGYCCDTELVIHSAKELEFILEESFGATGRGLHEKISSVEMKLPVPLVKRMRWLATIRNKLVHERGFTHVPDRPAFIAAFDESVVELQQLLGASSGKKGACAIA